MEKERFCRLLIGMHRPDKELIRALYSGRTTRTDSDYVQRSLRKIIVHILQYHFLKVNEMGKEHL